MCLGGLWSPQLVLVCGWLIDVEVPDPVVHDVIRDLCSGIEGSRQLPYIDGGDPLRHLHVDLHDVSGIGADAARGCPLAGLHWYAAGC